MILFRIVSFLDGYIILYRIDWNCLSNPNNRDTESHLGSSSKSLDMYFNKYKNVILLGNFSKKIEDSFMKSSCENYDLKKEPTCFKNPENPRCIDLILTNKR